MRVIAVEEHISTPELEAMSEREAVRLRDFSTVRLEDMDRLGIDMQVLSIGGTVAIQNETNKDKAIAASRKFNDFLAEIIARFPTRYAGFAQLPLAFPQSAADELERATSQLGLKGTMIRNHVNGRYLDDPMFSPLWERAEALEAPLYLHPYPSFRSPAVFDDFPELDSAIWGWGTEISSHALRIICSGLFDRWPRAKMILGHMGEMLPYCLWRIDSRWKTQRRGRVLNRAPSEYIKSNVIITTSGVFSNEPLLCAIAALGTESILFATDYPQDDTEAAMRFLRDAPISHDAREAIAHGNAERLLGL